MGTIRFGILLACLVGASLSLMGQRNMSLTERQLEDEKREIQKMVDLKADFFADAAVPTKWENESVVLLSQKRRFDFQRINNIVYRREMMRRRFWVKDAESAKKLSVLYMAAADEMGVRIIKANGSVEEVDVSKAIETEDEIPPFFKSPTRNFGYKKLELQDLAAGDMLDYYLIARELSPSSDFLAFTPVLYVLPTTYPIVQQQLEFHVEEGFYFNCNSYNSAPELSFLKQGTSDDFRAQPKRIYQLIDTMQAARKSELWNYVVCSSPIVKFQLSYCPNPKDAARSYYFLGEEARPKKRVNSTEIAQKLNQSILDFKDYTGDYYQDLIKKHIKKVGGDYLSPFEVATRSYYYFRYRIKVNPIKREFPLGPRNFTMRYDDDVDDYNFTAALVKLFRKYDLPVEVLAYTPRQYGSLDDLLLRGELRLALRLNLKDSSYFLTNFSPHTNFGDIPYDMEGVDAIALDPSFISNRNIEFKKIKIPRSQYTNNLHHREMKLTLDLAQKIVEIESESLAKGHARLLEWEQVMISSDYLMEEMGLYQEGRKVIMTKKKKEEKTQKLGELLEKSPSERDEKLKEVRSEQLGFDLRLYKDFELTQSGRYHHAPELQYKEVYDTEALLKQDGEDYVLEIGKLIGQQVHLEEKDLLRENDIYMPYARAFENVIELPIPQGYSIEGVDDLNVNIGNESGGFFAEAIVENGQLRITTSKIYWNAFEPKENWDDIRAFLQEADAFTKKVIRLKKQ